MNRKQAIERAEVMKAWGEGRPCQWRRNSLGVWLDLTSVEYDSVGNVNFDFNNNEYRIAPEEKPLLSIWHSVSKDRKSNLGFHFKKRKAEDEAEAMNSKYNLYGKDSEYEVILMIEEAAE